MANACESAEERFVVWTLLDTGLGVHELAGLKRDDLDWQGAQITIFGKGGAYGKKTKRRVVPLTTRIKPLIEAHFEVNESIGKSKRTLQRHLRACLRSPYEALLARKS